MDSAYPGPLARRPLCVPCDRGRDRERNAMHDTVTEDLLAAKRDRYLLEIGLPQIERYQARGRKNFCQLAVGKRD